jgi:hypothetical protein
MKGREKKRGRESYRGQTWEGITWESPKTEGRDTEAKVGRH